jgi:hypothetical protein
MRDAGPEGIEASDQGKQSVASESDDNSLFAFAQDRRTGGFGPRLAIFKRRPLTAPRDHLRVRRENAPPGRILELFTPEFTAQLDRAPERGAG